MRRRLAARARTTYPEFLVFGSAFGIIAGGLRRGWPDVGLAAMILIGTLVVPLALLPRLRRRVASATEADAEE